MPNTGQNNLIVPIQVNALYVAAGQTVMDAKADFSRLPWTDGTRDHHPYVPFLGESVLSPAFQNKNFTMESGVHLHWVLPRAHRTYPTDAKSDGKKKQPYPAPNRWLVTRGSTKWIIESDYINTKATIHSQNAVTVPYFSDESNQPYRFMGRQLPLSDWGSDSNASYWNSDHSNHPLTAFGYGELAFNTFYPNCRSVFGFFDPDPGTVATDAPVSYQVLGWYHEEENDIVAKAIHELNALISNPTSDKELLKKLFDNGGKCPSWLSEAYTNAATADLWNGYHINTSGSSYQYKHAMALFLTVENPVSLSAVFVKAPEAQSAFFRFGIQQLLNWNIESSGSPAGYPTQSLYYSSIKVDGTNNKAPDFDQVAIGNSGSEALSAYMGVALKSAYNTGEETPVKLETQLNAILHGSTLQGNLTDASLNFKEAIHESGFDAKDSGLLWRIRKIKISGDGHVDGEPNNESPLPDVVAGLLNELNAVQSRFDDGNHKLEQRQDQLYADWCKYMHCCYPPTGTSNNLPDEDVVMGYTERDLKNLEILQKQVGSITLKATPSESSATGIWGNELLGAYKAVYNYLNSPLEGQSESLNTILKATGYEYELSQVPAPRYYEAKDPVVLFAAEAIKTPQLKTDLKASPPVQLINDLSLETSGVPVQPDDLVAKLATPANYNSSTTEWSPHVLEWLVNFYPVSPGSNAGSADGDYGSEFLQTPIFNLNPDSFDYSQQNELVASPSAYKGSSYVSPTTKDNLLHSLKAFLLGRYPETLSESDFVGNSKIDKSWEQVSSQSTHDFSDPGCTAFETYQLLAGTIILTQAIRGFNQALVQRQQNIQLPISDPLGFTSYQDFTQNVSAALKGVNPPTPNPDDMFFPIRAGALQFSELSLTDHFGMATNPNVSSPIIANNLISASNAEWSWLAPRFSQATRLNFRWMAANSTMGSDLEVNSHPLTSPICGWVLPNYVDRTLVFYDQNGKGLGSFRQSDGGWNSFPCGLNPVLRTDLVPANPRQINSHLLNVLMALLAGTDKINGTAPATNFIEDLLSKIEQAQDSIYPENYAGHDALSILMGKPVAIVRATLNLEVKGDILHDQGWVPFRQQLQGSKPQTDAYEQVEVPINLGDPRQLNDGLNGFWKECDGQLDSNLNMITPNDNTLPLYQSLSEEPVTLTMFFDPHGVIHATTGVLPVKVIDIPPDQYTKALKNIEMAFFSAPLLTPTTNVQLSLPKESGYKWSWLQNNVQDGITSCQHTPDLPLISETMFTNAWNALVPTLELYPTESGTPWTEMVTMNWVCTAEGTDLYEVILPGDPNRKPLVTWAQYNDEIEQLIFKNLSGMTSFNTEVNFEQQELLEGWLMLSHIAESNTPQG